METAIELRKFGLAFGRRTLLAGVSRGFKRGSLVALIGRNGSGKSTMLKALAGINTAYTGEIRYEGRDLRRLTPGELALILAVVTTERPRISSFTCRDLVALGRAPYTNWTGRLSAADRAVIDTSLERVGMADFANRQLDSLSDGEAQRVLIAKAFAQDTPVMLLDEPTSFLDIPNRYNIVRLLASMAHDSGKCIIYSTHELDIALQLSDCISLIDPPALLAGTPEEIGPTARRLFTV